MSEFVVLTASSLQMGDAKERSSLMMDGQTQSWQLIKSTQGNLAKRMGEEKREVRPRREEKGEAPWHKEKTPSLSC